jgi:hypothetical protein
MANAEKGEVDIDLGGRSYTLVVNVNAMCEVETLLSTPLRRVTYQDVLNGVKYQSVVSMRALLWCALREHHKEVTLEQAGRLMDGDDGLNGFAKKLADLVFATTPAKSDIDALGIKPRPPKAQRKKRVGTGTRSISKPATPA